MTTSTTTTSAAAEAPEPLSRADRAFNFGACLIDAIGWPLGIAFFSPTTILPLFLRHLHASNATIGALGALMNLLIFLPGLLVVGHLGRLPRARNYLFVIALIERFALLPLVWLTPLWGVSHPSWLIVALFAVVCVHAGAMGLNQPAYWIVVGKTIPARWRGRLFGYAGGISGLLGFGTEWLLRNRVLGGPDGGFPDGFARGFLLSFLILTVSVLPLGMVREPAAVVPPVAAGRRPGGGRLWRDARAVWRANAGFRRFLIAQIVFTFAAVALPFFVLYARRRLGAGAGDVSAYTAALIFAAAFGNLGWGALADRFGNRIVLVASCACALAAGALALAAATPGVFLLVFVASALASAGVGLAGNNIVLEYAGATPDAADIALYTVLYNTVTALPRAAAPLAGGLIADNLGYRPLFFFSLALAGASLLLTLRVHEPRRPVAAAAPG